MAESNRLFSILSAGTLDLVNESGNELRRRYAGTGYDDGITCVVGRMASNFIGFCTCLPVHVIAIIADEVSAYAEKNEMSKADLDDLRSLYGFCISKSTSHDDIIRFHRKLGDTYFLARPSADANRRWLNENMDALLTASVHGRAGVARDIVYTILTTPRNAYWRSDRRKKTLEELGIDDVHDERASM